MALFYKSNSLLNSHIAIMCRLQLFRKIHHALSNLFVSDQMLLQRSVKNLPQIYTIYPKYTKSTPNIHKIHFPTFSPNFHFLLFSKNILHSLPISFGSGSAVSPHGPDLYENGTSERRLAGDMPPIPGLGWRKLF